MEASLWEMALNQIAPVAGQALRLASGQRKGSPEGLPVDRFGLWFIRNRCHRSRRCLPNRSIGCPVASLL